MDIVIFSTKGNVPVVWKICNPDIFPWEPMCLDYWVSTVYFRNYSSCWYQNCYKKRYFKIHYYIYYSFEKKIL